MPLHVYAPVTPPCKLCGGTFEHHHERHEAPLTMCPTCGQPVSHQPVQRANSLKLSAGRSVSRAKQAGFTVLQPTTDGGFERK